MRTITDKPVRYVINTHEHPDHIFGNAAFDDPGVTFVGHRNLPASIQAHGPFYLHSFRDALGADAIAQVRLIPPTVLVDSTMTLDLGGRTLLLTAWYPPAHTDCDLTVLDEQTHTLFSGDLVFLDHVPVIDGSVKGWLDVLPRLAALPAERVLPGHGRRVAPWPEALDDERRYLLTVQADARKAHRIGHAAGRGGAADRPVGAGTLAVIRRLQSAQRHGGLQRTRMGVSSGNTCYTDMADQDWAGGEMRTIEPDAASIELAGRRMFLGALAGVLLVSPRVRRRDTGGPGPVARAGGRRFSRIGFCGTGRRCSRSMPPIAPRTPPSFRSPCTRRLRRTIQGTSARSHW